MDKVIASEQDRTGLLKFLQVRKLPFTVSIVSGKKRTDKQNKLQRLWMPEIAEMFGETAEYWRGFCKLHFGVPILRAENAEFRAAYDKHIRPLPYESKIAAMMVPLDMPVTRLMTTVQKTKYLDEIARHFAGQGLVLTDPDGVPR